jgi:predicted phage terminase large subunit-like protein
VKRHAREYGPNRVLIEDASSGKQLLQSLHCETDLPLKPVPVDTDKLTRLEWVSPYIERGRVYLPEDAPWLDEFLKEVLAFPSAKHDDQVDSLSQFLRWAMAHEQYRIPQVHVRLIGETGIRDHYRERMGISGFPKGW